jgi:hypothetical protein
LDQHIYKDSDASGEIMLWCPFCADRENHSHGHMYMERNSGFWHCIYCGRGGKKILKLLQAYGIHVPYQEKIKLQLDDTSSEVSAALKKTEAQSQELSQFIRESRSVKEGSWGHDYLVKKRGMSEADVRLYWREWPKMPQYVFWTLCDEKGTPTFFSGRAYVKGTKSKYYHMRGTIPMVLFNQHEFVPTPRFKTKTLVFIVEGIFDAFFAPGPAIPLFSKKMSNSVREELKRTILVHNLAPVAALDKDEIEDNIELASLLHTWREETYLFKMSPCKDFGENKMSTLTNDSIHSRLTLFLPQVKNLMALRLQS